MLGDSAFWEQLMSTFQVEMEEHLRTLNQGLLALEEGVEPTGRPVLIQPLFRAAHSLKGAARAIGLEAVGMIAHRLEDALDLILKQDSVLSPALFDVLLLLLDAIREASALDKPPIGRYAALFERLETAMRESLAGAQPQGAELPQILTAFTEGAGKTGTDASLPAEGGGATAEERMTGAGASPEPQALDAAEPQISTQSAMGTGRTPRANASLHAETGEAAVQDSLLHAPPGDSHPHREAGVPARAKTAAPGEETIRVATSRLDALMDGLGELLTARLRMDESLEQTRRMQRRLAGWQKSWRKVRPHYTSLVRHPKTGNELTALLEFHTSNHNDLDALQAEVDLLTRRLVNDRTQLQLVTDMLENGIRRARMLPISTLFDIFPRMLRDLARESGKHAALLVEGGDTEVDRQALELMKDPLTHLVRNAVGHGIELPDVRAAAGKARQGHIWMRAEARGSNLVLEVADDGGGIDLEGVRAQAVARGLVLPADAEKLSPEETLELIFLSGVSTASHVSGISGRGVGMDVVRRNLEALHGLIQVENNPGKGTAFRMTLPLTFSASRVLLVSAGGEKLALPMVNIERIQRVAVQQVGSIDGKPAIHIQGRLMPLYDLAQALHLPGAGKSPPQEKIAVLALNVVEKHAALRVDGFLSTQEVVVKDLGRQVRRVRNVSGAAILGDGQIVIVLDPAGLMRSLDETLPGFALPAPAPQKMRQHLLVVDDSITTRSLEKSILENAGYAVTTAADGSAAWDLLRSAETAPPDLVISDINMPLMDGFDLTRAIKGDQRTARIPVVLVTSRDSQQDRLRGLEAGADGYIVKTSFDQRELLDIIEQLIH